MRIATYNLFEGAKSTYPQLIDFVAREELDVICLQETNEWQNGATTRLQQFAKDTGMKAFVLGDSNTEFKLATFSRTPITGSAAHAGDFWHSALSTTIQYHGRDLTLWNVHLSPGSEDDRMGEAKSLIGLIAPEKLTIVAGDFNSLSETDGYPPSVIDVLSEKGITKFGKGKLRFDVINHFKHRGLIDLAAALDATDTTVPTQANQDLAHAADLRLDYMFGSAEIAKAARNIKVPKTPLTETISDHYPIVLTLE